MMKNPVNIVERRADVAPRAERELHEKMQGLRAQLAGDKQASVSFLQQAGILTRTGNLTKAYR